MNRLRDTAEAGLRDFGVLIGNGLFQNSEMTKDTLSAPSSLSRCFSPVPASFFSVTYIVHPIIQGIMPVAPDRDFTRQEGAYCHWESYPPDSPGIRDNILVLEHVNGDCTVSKLEVTREDARKIRNFLVGTEGL